MYVVLLSCLQKDKHCMCHCVLLENEKLVTKMNVCYIVCGILINEKQEILMMQEAKTSCYGLWYLPAGRMEVNENIEVNIVCKVVL